MSINSNPQANYILRMASHQFKDTTINILINLDNGKYFVLDSEGWFEASKDMNNEKECYEYIKAVYGADYEA